MAELTIEDLLPMPPHMGPPLPRFLVLYWPWYEERPPGTYRLTIFRVGNGTVTPGSGDYEAGTTVTLTAVPDTGAVFDHWSGDATGTSPTVDVLMDRGKEVTAHFVGGPDIRVENLVISPTEVNLGQPVTISCLVTNIGASAGDYTVRMGGDFIAEQIVTLQPSESKTVAFDVTPTVAKTYQVSVDGLSGSFKAVGVAQAEFYMPAEMRKSKYPTIEPYTVCEVWVKVTNNGDAPGTQVVHVWDSVGNVDDYITVTLKSGETKTCFHRTQWIDFSRISPYWVKAEGDWKENNYSEAIFP